jgi:membrane-associated protease RseP (regulator of RpoE activity)
MRMHIAISATVLTCGLTCGLVVTGQTQSNGPAVRQAQGLDACGWIGVRVNPMTPAFAASLGMAEPYGAIFDRPEPGSPAANAKIEAGDVITTVNGSPVMRSSEFAAMISAMAPGAAVYLTTFRNGQMIKVALTLDRGKCADGLNGGALSQDIRLADDRRPANASAPSGSGTAGVCRPRSGRPTCG